MLARENIKVRTYGTQEDTKQDSQKASLLARPILAVTSPARPESAKTTSSPRDASCPQQGHSSEADPRFTFHDSRFTVLLSEARTPLADFFSLLSGESAHTITSVQGGPSEWNRLIPSISRSGSRPQGR